MAQVILVDESDTEIGTLDKMEAHQKGLLHRAFSILLFNAKGEVLLQKRSSEKYHSAGRWTNACCSHPLPGEAIAVTAKKQLKFEMGIDLQPVFEYKFRYQTMVDNGLTEHELDHVFVGIFDGVPVINKNEVEDWKFMTSSTLIADIHQNPEAYTPWFRLMVADPHWQKFIQIK